MTDTTFVGWQLPELVTPDGTERGDPSIAALSGGGYVITWEQRVSGTGQPEYDDVYAQIFTDDGTAVGSAFQVNTFTTGHQTLSAVAGLDGGDFVVVWQSDGQDGDGYGIYAQRYNSSGVAQGSETLVNTTTASDQSEPEITALSNGGYAVSWYEKFDNGDGTFTIAIKLQQYTSAGIADGSQTTIASELVNEDLTFGTEVDYSGIRIVELTGGELAISWDRFQYSGNVATAQAQILDGATLLASVVEPEQTTDQSGTFPQTQIVALGNGNLLMVYGYQSGVNGAAGVGYGEVYGRIYTADGVAVGDEFAIVTGTENRRFDFSAVSDGNGGALIGFELEHDTENERYLFVQQVDEDGNLQGSPFQVDSLSGGSSSFSDMTLLANGNVATAWMDGYSVYHRILVDGEDGRFDDGVNVVTLGNGGENVAALGGEDDVTGGSGNDTISGGSDNDTLRGEAGNDVLDGGDGDDDIGGGADDDLIFGQAGDDTLAGDAGNDTIVGGAGNDTIDGGDNDDVLYGSGGEDTIHGGSGNDYVYGYIKPFTRIEPGDPDEDAGFTNYVYGDDGDDWVYGGSGNDVIDGGDGNDNLYGGHDAFIPSGDDLFIGSKGDDTIRGFGGFDTVDYSAMASAVTVVVSGFGGSQERYVVTIAAAGADPQFEQDLYDISQIIGSSHNDMMTGHDNDDIFDGGDGDDTLDGAGGVNTAAYSSAGAGVTVSLALQGGAQDTVAAGMDTLSNFANLTGSAYGDTLAGDANDNVIKGLDGDDVIEGGDGDDTIDGGDGTDGASYANAASRVIVDLRVDVLQNTQGAGRDILLNVENLLGSDYNDDLKGGTGVNELRGGLGDDVLRAKGDDGDVLYGQDGDDVLRGDAGDNVMYGGIGEDVILGAQGNDEMHGGDDRDIMVGSSGDDTIYGNGGDDELRGNTGTDYLYGGAGLDDLRGGSNNDFLYGGADRDLLYGENANDLLDGGTGDDTMTGGIGADIFVYDIGYEFDRIRDFGDGNDQIDLSAIAGMTDLAAVEALMTETATGHVNINFGGGDILQVQNHVIADFDTGDFIFAVA